MPVITRKGIAPIARLLIRTLIPLPWFRTVPRGDHMSELLEGRQRLAATESHVELQTRADHLRRVNHSTCCACGGTGGFGLSFDITGPASVEGAFECAERWQGYDGVLHGGVICLLLDAAMTHCGFALRREVMTGDMSVRFLHPVPIGETVCVRAAANDCVGPLQRIQAQILLGERVMARAVGRFVDRSLVQLPMEKSC